MRIGKPSNEEGVKLFASNKIHEDIKDGTFNLMYGDKHILLDGDVHADDNSIEGDGTAANPIKLKGIDGYGDNDQLLGKAATIHAGYMIDVAVSDGKLVISKKKEVGDEENEQINSRYDELSGRVSYLYGMIDSKAENQQVETLSNRVYSVETGKLNAPSTDGDLGDVLVRGANGFCSWQKITSIDAPIESENPDLVSLNAKVNNMSSMIQACSESIDAHTGDRERHVDSWDKERWKLKMDKPYNEGSNNNILLSDGYGNSMWGTIKEVPNAATSEYVDSKYQAVSDSLDAHSENAEVHITNDERWQWNDKMIQPVNEGEAGQVLVKTSSDDRDIYQWQFIRGGNGGNIAPDPVYIDLPTSSYCGWVAQFFSNTLAVAVSSPSGKFYQLERDDFGRDMLGHCSLYMYRYYAMEGKKEIEDGWRVWVCGIVSAGKFIELPTTDGKGHAIHECDLLPDNEYYCNSSGMTYHLHHYARNVSKITLDCADSEPLFMADAGSAILAYENPYESNPNAKQWRYVCSYSHGWKAWIIKVESWFGGSEPDPDTPVP